MAAPVNCRAASRVVVATSSTALLARQLWGVHSTREPGRTWAGFAGGASAGAQGPRAGRGEAMAPIPMKMPPLATGLVVVANVCLATTLSAGQSETALHRFLAEYPAASEKLEDYYRHVRIYFSRTDNYRGDIVEYELLREGDSLRLVELDGKRSGEPYYAKVVDPDLVFKLKQSTTRSPYSVTIMGKCNPTDYKGWANVTLSNAAIALAPYGAYLPGSIRELLAVKALTVRSARELDDRSIEVEWEGGGAGLAKSRGAITFLPDACWAVRDYAIRFIVPKGAKPPIDQYGHVDYQGYDHGIPIVQRLQMWRAVGDERDPSFTFEVKDLVHGPVPKEEFTLGAFAVRTSPTPLPVPVMYYLLALSALCAVMVLVLRYVRNRA